MKKANINIIVLLFLISFLGMQSGFTILFRTVGYEPDGKLRTSQTTSLIIGVRNGPYSLDPHDTWDPDSYNVIEQVCEGLFTYNLSHPNKEIIPRLASDFGTWSIDGLNYTVPLQQNVFFHDATPFNAAAVKWNFDRLAYLMNATGDLPEPMTPCRVDSVYRWLDGTPFINRTEERDLYTIRFVLNKPFGGFEALLCFSGSYMMSPTSTPFTTILDVNTDILTGTGPFVYDLYISSTSVTFHAFDSYWRTNSTITNLMLKIIPDPFSLTQALIDGDIDVLINPSRLYFDNITNAGNLNLTESKKGSWVIFYLGINNHLIDRNFREAISYAFNYSHIATLIKGAYIERLKSPIPKSMYYSNYSYNVPVYNLTKAREVMQSMGYGIGWNVTSGGPDESLWTSANFRTLNFTHIEGSTFQEEVGDLLIENLDRLGITVEVYNNTWIELLNKLEGMRGFTRDMLELFYIGWSADYNDPSQIINHLLSNSTYAFNSVQYNGGFGGFTPYSEENDVQLLMEQAISSIDNDERNQLYNKIQQLIIERDFPWGFGFTPKTYIAYHEDLEGVEENAFISVDEEGGSSMKGDFQLLSWAYTSVPGGEIPGYQMILVMIISLISVIYLMKFKIFKSKK